MLSAPACAEPAKTATSASAPKDAIRASKPLRILILGGTGNIGPHFLRTALDRGHRVSVFIYRAHKEKGLAELSASVEPLLGDRNGDLSSIQNRDWDAVFDLATYVPNWVRTLGQALAGRVGHYSFISTLATYKFPGVTDEHSEVLPYADSVDPYTLKTIPMGQYGPLKVLCEREAERQFPGKTFVARLGHPVGPNESMGALTYWVARMQQGGEVIAAGDPLTLVQLLDARDLAEWTLRMAESGTSGAFNTVGPALPLGWSEMIGAIRGAFSVPTKLTWVPIPWLLEQKLGPFSSALFWPTEFGTPGGWRLNNEKARANGLTFRALNTTIADTLDWYNRLPAQRRKEVVMGFDDKNKALEDSMARERELLAAWHARRAGSHSSAG